MATLLVKQYFSCIENPLYFPPANILKIVKSVTWKPQRHTHKYLPRNIPILQNLKMQRWSTSLKILEH